MLITPTKLNFIRGSLPFPIIRNLKKKQKKATKTKKQQLEKNLNK